MQSLGTTRRQLLGAAAVGSSVLLLPDAARAAATPVAPQGDDVGFLNFGAVAAGVLARVYSDAQRVRGAFSRDEKRFLARAHDRELDALARLNAALGPEDAVSLEDYSRVVALGSRAGALKVARRLESTVTGVYLQGAAQAADPGTRLLLGRLLALSSAQHAELTRLAHERPAGLPEPVDLEVAGRIVDRYLKDPTS